MAIVKLKVIPKPAEGTASLIRTDQGKDYVFMKGEGPGGGPDDMVCGSCGKVLLEKLRKGQVQGIVFECPKCGAFNLT